MICQAIYDSFDAIPEALRAEFENKNGKWQLKDDAIPGVGPLFNAAVYANEQRAITQAKNKQTRIEELERQNSDLKLASAGEPGSVTLTKEDAALWKEYTPLGTPKDLKKKIALVDELQVKVGQVETADQIQKVVKDTGLNHEVLTDWAMSPDGKGVSFFTKTSKDASGKEVVTAYAKIETDKGGGKVEVSEVELLPFAKEKLPEWKYDALVAAGDKKTTTTTQPAAGTGTRLPNLGSTRTGAAEGNGGNERPVDRFNKARTERPSPFAPPVNNAATK